MNIEQMLVRWGIPTFKTNIQVDLTGVKQQNLNQKAPVNIGWIYGMSVNIGGHLPDDNVASLITKADSGNLWLTLKIGSKDFIENWRLSDLMFQEDGVTRTQEMNYAPVSIPMGSNAKGNSMMDWQKSYVKNPSGIADKTILFTVWYIDIPSYENLVASKALWVTGNAGT